MISLGGRYKNTQENTGILETYLKSEFWNHQISKCEWPQGKSGNKNQGLIKENIVRRDHCHSHSVSVGVMTSGSKGQIGFSQQDSESTWITLIQVHFSLNKDGCLERELAEKQVGWTPRKTAWSKQEFWEKLLGTLEFIVKIKQFLLKAKGIWKPLDKEVTNPGEWLMSTLI